LLKNYNFELKLRLHEQAFRIIKKDTRKIPPKIPVTIPDAR